MKSSRVEYEWHLRKVMALNGILAATDLEPLLAERGVKMSSTQVAALVTQPPEQLNLEVLAALCGILSCTPDDLIGDIRVIGTLSRRRSARAWRVTTRAWFGVRRWTKRDKG